MTKKNEPGVVEWVDPDEAPELTEAFFDNAEYFHGDRFIRRGRGRPKTDTPKEQISVRLDRDVLAKLREAGAGWQSQINALLRQSLRLEPTREHAGPPPDTSRSATAPTLPQQASRRPSVSGRK
jgi:uncharacterized protein (DUF4415 family)